MKCNCSSFNYKQAVFDKQLSWQFQRNIFMGKLYKCEYCGSFWVSYSSGHGWNAYYKYPDDTVFEELGKTEEQLCESKTMYEQNIKWDCLVKRIPKEEEKVIHGIIIEHDVMSVLRFIFIDDRVINKWLFTYREKKYGFETPIELLNRNEGVNILKSILLEIVDNNIARY